MNNFLYLLFGITFLCCNSVLSLQWEKTFGGASLDAGGYVLQIANNGYIISGATLSFGSGEGDAWLIKTDANGNEIWNRTYGDPPNQSGLFVQQTFDGGYILGGEVFYSIQNKDLLLIKTDSEGYEEWTKTYGSPDLVELFGSALQTTDGGYILVSTTWIFATNNTKDIWLVKTDSEGNLEWDKTFGNPNYDESGEDVIQIGNESYIITGSMYAIGTGFYDLCLIKTDLEGNEIWTRTYGYTNASEHGMCVLQKEDGGFIVTGGISIYNYLSDILLLSTDSEGNYLWHKSFGGYDEEIGYTVDQTDDGGFFIAGNTESFGAGNEDFWIIKTDTEGNDEWNKTFGGSETDHTYCGLQTADNGYIVIGTTYSYGAGTCDAWLIYYNPTAYEAPLFAYDIAIFGSLVLLISFIIFILKIKGKLCNLIKFYEE